MIRRFFAMLAEARSTLGESLLNSYLIALGSNLGDREYYINQAIDAIRRKCGPITALGPLLETAAWGGAAEGAFLNTALVCETSLEPEALLKELLEIESEYGRVRDHRWGNRTLDCDVILWRRGPGDFPVVQTPRLSIPHPEAHRRLFVLDPALPIAGDWIHPVEGRTLRELWNKLKDPT